MDEFVGENIKEKYDFIRRVVEHEDNLVNHRVSWLLIAQSFLLAACITSNKYPLFIVLLGAGSTVATYLSILAALKVINKLRDEVLKVEEFQKILPIPISKGDISYYGVTSAYFTPPMFLLVWIYIGFSHYS